MTNFEYNAPSREEINAIERNARKLQAELMAQWVRGAVNWLKSPVFGRRFA